MLSNLLRQTVPITVRKSLFRRYVARNEQIKLDTRLTTSVASFTDVFPCILHQIDLYQSIWLRRLTDIIFTMQDIDFVNFSASLMERIRRLYMLMLSGIRVDYS